MYWTVLEETQTIGGTDPAAFPATRWSLVLAARSDSGSALAELCRVYWYPLYAYARRAGNSPEDAEDLTQGFLAKLLERDGFNRTDAKNGKLRSFLLAALKNYMRDEWRNARRKKRGGGIPVISIDIEEIENKYTNGLVDEMTPDLAYDRLWVLTLLDQVMKELSEECARTGKADILSRVCPYLNGSTDDSCPYANLAKELELSESGTRVLVHRLRVQYRERLRSKIADTLDSPAELDSELAYLMSLFSR